MLFRSGDDKEMMNLQEMTDKFDIKKIHKGGGSFNMEKLDWFNAHYIARLTDDELKGFYKEANRSFYLRPKFLLKQIFMLNSVFSVITASYSLIILIGILTTSPLFAKTVSGDIVKGRGKGIPVTDTYLTIPHGFA